MRIIPFKEAKCNYKASLNLVQLSHRGRNSYEDMGKVCVTSTGETHISTPTRGASRCKIKYWNMDRHRAYYVLVWSLEYSIKVINIVISDKKFNRGIDILPVGENALNNYLWDYKNRLLKYLLLLGILYCLPDLQGFSLWTHAWSAFSFIKGA